MIKHYLSAFWTYFGSVFDNTVGHLIIALAGLSALFVGRHLYLNLTMWWARRDLPIVIGGWGTRGKSGTERLKAALLNSLGKSIVSKTTGCEAMFLYAFPNGQTKEMFLYRSYDKATIWEQRFVAQLGQQLHSDAFLWECMGLTPSYVQILQRSWMRDDISTITNTYPDHEDIQGPAGINIPQVMTCFIPRGTRLITSEEQMLPILRDAAIELNTTFEQVGWYEAGLLASDVLKRFPYEEHPYNIALVVQVAKHLGMTPDDALREMADRVVPDLGVLKTSPIATIRTRRLQFSNGMSANERHGCINNWLRLGFDQITPDSQPGVWVTTVVNNRADRIPRSRVFASILVNDLSADRHVLIGGNLSGLKTYIREAWTASLPNLTLWPDVGDADPLAEFTKAGKRFRIATSRDELRQRVASMFERLQSQQQVDQWWALVDQPEQLRSAMLAAGINEAIVTDALSHVELWRAGWKEFEAFAHRLRQAGKAKSSELNRAFADLAWQWFERKLVVIEDYYATGDKIIDTIAGFTPPGYLNRVMGIQNIKGTGLDFVYRWEAWSACHRLGERARSTCLEESGTLEPARQESAIRDWLTFTDFGVLSQEYVKSLLEQVRQTRFGQSAEGARLLDQHAEKFAEKMAVVISKFASQASKGWLASIVQMAEKFLDPSDAIRRRKAANQIYRDLIDHRISLDRAVSELQAVTARSKGGWLSKLLRIS